MKHTGPSAYLVFVRVGNLKCDTNNLDEGDISVVPARKHP